MTTPPETIGPDANLVAAARTMARCQVRQLPVVEETGRPVGIVSRSDLVRPDDAIRDEILHELRLTRTPWTRLDRITVAVHDGVATLAGELQRRSEVCAAVRVASRVTGVADIHNALTYTVDDTSAAYPRSEEPVIPTTGTPPTNATGPCVVSHTALPPGPSPLARTRGPRQPDPGFACGRMPNARASRPTGPRSGREPAPVAVRIHRATRLHPERATGHPAGGLPRPRPTVLCHNPPGRPAAAVTGVVVAFGADEIDATCHGSWSVTVLGHATAVTDSVDVAALSAMPVLPGTVDDRRYVVRITIEQITGCRLDLGTAPSPGADTHTDTDPRR